MSGSAFAGFKFNVQDDGGTADMGQDTDWNDKDMTLNVTWVNQTPSFSASDPASGYGGADVRIDNWATFNPGAPDETSQTATYIVSNISDPNFFDVAPTVSADCTLSYTLADIDATSGSASFDLKVQD